MEIREMRAALGDTQQEFCKRYGIPPRTLQSWEQGTRSCPDYVVALLEYAVVEDTKAIAALVPSTERSNHLKK